ncbi:MAG: sensor domain-containing diguanylate cyclase [Longimicrobiales bacterium]
MRVHAGSTPLDERYCALLDLGRVLTGLVRSEDLYRALADRVTGILEADFVLISGYDAATDLATIAFTADGSPRSAGHRSYRGAECLAIRESRPLTYPPGEPAAACVAAGLDVTRRPAMVAPILREGRVLGTVTLLGRTDGVYDSSDIEFLCGITNLVASRAIPSPVASGTDGGRLAEITQAIAAVALPDALAQIGRAAVEASGADAAVLWLLRSTGDVEAAFSTGALAPRKGSTVALSHELFRSLADRREPVLLESDSSDARTRHFLALVAGTSSVVLPLVAESRVLGALVICFATARTVSRSDLPSLQRLAELGGIAVGYSRLHEQIHALSLIDPLTALANRRHLAMFLEKEFAAARRGRRLTLLYLDIDGFADYNRKAGRPAGDAALRAFAEVIAAQTRAMNLAARYGADEFIVALADADRRAGFIHASRIAKAMAAHPLISSSGLHVSVGISSFSPRMAGFDDMIRAAQNDLSVRRKGGGRLTI